MTADQSTSPRSETPMPEQASGKPPLRAYPTPACVRCHQRPADVGADFCRQCIDEAEHMTALAASTPITAEHMTALAASTLDNPVLVRWLDGRLGVIPGHAYRPILWQRDLDAVELQGYSPESQAVVVNQLESFLIAGDEVDRG